MTRLAISGFAAMLLSALTLPGPAFAQALPPEPRASAHARAIAAGYKALMTCSAVFNARAMGGVRTPASVDAWELAGIYPEYDALVSGMRATIDRDRVTVGFDAKLPPRVAISRGRAGCVIHPVGTDPALPARTAAQTPANIASATWPIGEPKGAVAPDARLAPLFAKALSGGYGGRTTAVLVAQRGRLIGEAYAPDFGPDVPQRTWSVAKSIAGTLIGAAALAKGFDADKPANLGRWRSAGDPRAAITVDHLLRMASGLHSDTAGNRTDAIYFGGTGVAEQAESWGLEAVPGTRFRYANNDILLAIRALRQSGRVTGTGFADDLLFRPMGLSHLIAEQDWQGDYVLSSQIWATARDLARFGQLWLDDGRWAGKRLLPTGWMQRMTAPRGPQPTSGPGYGATLWLFGPAQGLPAGSFAALGNRGQVVFVVPSQQLIIVRRGEDRGGGGFATEAFAKDIAAALP